MTYKFVVNALNHYAMLLGNEIGKENNYKIMLDFTVYFDRKYVTTWRCPIPT